jgi:hypothetical protein
MLTALTGYLTSPRVLTVLTANMASTAIGAKKSSSLNERKTWIIDRTTGEVPHLLSNNLARHTRPRNVDECFPPKRIYLNAQLILHEPDRLPARKAVSRDDRRRVDPLLHELVRAPQQLRSDDHDRGRPVAHFLVLLLREVDKDTSCGMFD